MGGKRKAERNKSGEEAGKKLKLVKHAGLPPKPCESLHSSLLSATAQHRMPSNENPPCEDKFTRPGKQTRAMARAAADNEGATPMVLPPLGVPPEELSQEAVLTRRLEHIRSLKTFYGRAHLSMLSHLIDLAAAMKASQKPVLHELDPQMPRPGSSKDTAEVTGKAVVNDPIAEALRAPRQEVKAVGKEALTSPKGGAGPKASTSSKGMTSPKAGAHKALTSPKALGVTSPKALSKLEVASPKAGAAAAVPLPSFSEAEDEVLRHHCRGRHSGAGGAHTPLLERLTKAMPVTASLQMLANNMQGLADLERVAASAAARDMDRREACAVLCGQHTRFYLHQTMVIIGRKSKTKGEVDVDLTLEGPSTKLSRIQCLLELDLDMGYVLRNLGRQSVFVNNIEVGQGHKIKVPHMSLLEIGGIRVMFMFNQAAVRRLMPMRAPCPRDMTDPV